MDKPTGTSRTHGTDAERLILRPFYDHDILQMERWLYLSHVAKWYKHPEHWLRELRDRNEEFAFITHFIAEYDGDAFGFCQYYDCYYSQLHEVWHEHWRVCDKQGEIFSIDYLIGETDCLRRGFGKAIVAELIGKLRTLNAGLCIVSPEIENTTSCRVLEANGFRLSNGEYALDL